MFGKKSKPSVDDELIEYIKSYARYEDDLLTLTKHDHFDLIEDTVLLRDAIHEHLLAHQNIKESYVSQIRQLDKEWQDWIIKNKQEDFHLVDVNRHGVPKDQWWFWIDCLDQLSDVERSTL